LKFLKLRIGKDTEESVLLRNFRQTGDLAVLGRIYQPYMGLVFACCYKYLDTEEDAEDAVMELFEKINVELRKHEPQDFSAWLFSVARNYCLMKKRQRVLKMDGSGLEDSELYGGAEDIVPIHEEQLEQLQACLERLPAPQRQSVDLFYLQKKCYKEIAELTGYEIKRVKSYIQNGKRNLKICMGRDEKAQ
jgi:RNA polymerase sigma factor (sigma-70 family)